MCVLFLSIASLFLGESQQSTNTTGSLITSSRSVGNFRTLLLKTQVGLWEIKMVSASAYTLKVVGENSVIITTTNAEPCYYRSLSHVDWFGDILSCNTMEEVTRVF